MKRHASKASRFFCVLALAVAVSLLSCAGSGRIGSSTKRGSMITGSADRDMKRGRPASMKMKKDASASLDAYKGRPGGAKAPDTGKQKRMVMYRAECEISVESVSASLGQIDGIIKRFSGFIESSATSDSYRRARIVIRVPVKHFDEALSRVLDLGTVLKRVVSAADVTMEYHDLSIRIDTAKKVRARMYDLLKRTRKVEDRVKILREIERLTRIIETSRTRLRYLKSRADFSTIILTLKAQLRDTVTRYVPSPFPWIANLKHDRRSILDRGRGVSYEAPQGLYRLDARYYKNRENCYLFTNPGGTLNIRPGIVKNYPPADLAFWDSALSIDMKSRQLEQILRKKVKAAGGLVLARNDLRLPGRGCYSISIGISGKRILVVEAFFLTEAVYKKEVGKLDKFLKSVRFK